MNDKHINDVGPATLISMPETMATASFTDTGDVLITGMYDRPLRALEAKQRTMRHRASLDLISTEQAEEYARQRVQEALEAAADAIASNAQACEDAITRLVLDSNERALREMVPLLRTQDCAPTDEGAIRVDFLQSTGQYITNDATREAAIAEALAAEREACIRARDVSQKAETIEKAMR